jgi:hypothetical protein
MDYLRTAIDFHRQKLVVLVPLSRTFIDFEHADQLPPVLFRAISDTLDTENNHLDALKAVLGQLEDAVRSIKTGSGE